MIAEPGEVICRTHENAVVEMDGEVVAVAYVQDAEKSVTLKEACNPTKSECLSTRETTQDIPDTPAKFARESGEVGIQTRKARSGDIEGLHREQQAVAKQVWMILKEGHES